MVTKSKWVIDTDNSEISFVVNQLKVSKIKGIFNEFDAVVYTNGNSFENAKIDFTLNPSLINTGDKMRDNHLKSAEFFDVENYNRITFISETFAKAEKNETYNLSGYLTIKGITKRLNLKVEFGGIIKDKYNNENAGFSLTGKINRRDYELNWNGFLGTGFGTIGEEVIINCEVELIKKKQALLEENKEIIREKERVFLSY